MSTVEETSSSGERNHRLSRVFKSLKLDGLKKDLRKTEISNGENGCVFSSLVKMLQSEFILFGKKILEVISYILLL